MLNVEAGKNKINPLKPFSVLASGSGNGFGRSKDRGSSANKPSENSISITFEDSSSEHCDTKSSSEDCSLSESSDCLSREDSKLLAEDTTGGIVFQTNPEEIKVRFCFIHR